MTLNETRTVVLTGSSGYLGKQVIQNLEARGFHVIEVDVNNPKNPINLSVFSDGKKLELPTDYFLIHLAFPLPGALPSPQFEALINDININICEWFSPQRTLFISSTAVYPLNEASVIGPAPWEIYGALKLESEVFLKKNLEFVTIFRPGTLIEVGRKSSMMNFIKQLKSSRTPFFPSDGDLVHPFTHTNDLVSAIAKWVSNPDIEPGIYDLVALSPLTFSQISEIQRSERIILRIKLPRFLFGLIGSDRFPIMNISRWHFRALFYNFDRKDTNVYRETFRSYVDIFTF